MSTTSVTDAGSIPAASSRMASCPARGKPGNSVPSPESIRIVRPPLRTTATFSGQSIISGGRNISRSHADNSARSTLVASVSAVIGSTPSLITSTSMSPTRSA
ncbi:hypothetical protein RPX00_31840 [Amycolatopsis sp. WGS_07]